MTIDRGLIETDSIGDGGDVDALAPSSITAQLVWPVAGWIASTDRHVDGTENSGSADIAAPYWTPVGAGGEGVVERAGLDPDGGYFVVIGHADGYTTAYSHLSEPALVTPGQKVATGQLIGYSGRTGNADRNGAHVYFIISKNGARVPIPNIALGDWVRRSDPVPGSYGAIPLTADRGDASFDVKVVATSASVLADPNPDAAIVGEAHTSDVLRVSDTQSGFYFVSGAGVAGWVPHVMTVPIKSALSLAIVTANPANVRSAPSPSATLLGELPTGTLVTLFEQAGDWHRLLFGSPATYSWTYSANVASTPRFGTRIRAKTADVRVEPRSSASLLGTLTLVDPIVVEEVNDGWYRIDFAGKPGWVGGWLTQGPF